MYGFEALTFNIHGGYLEAIVRGHISGLLTSADYNNLCLCESLDDIKMHLSATEYGPYLQNEPSPLHTTTIVDKCILKLVDEYKHHVMPSYRAFVNILGLHHIRSHD